MDNTWVRKLNINNQFEDYFLAQQEDEELMKNIDMDEVERAIDQAEREIANGQGIEFREAMAQIHREVFGEEI